MRAALRAAHPHPHARCPQKWQFLGGHRSGDFFSLEVSSPLWVAVFSLCKTGETHLMESLEYD